MLYIYNILYAIYFWGLGDIPAIYPPPTRWTAAVIFPGDLPRRSTPLMSPGDLPRPWKPPRTDEEIRFSARQWLLGWLQGLMTTLTLILTLQDPYTTPSLTQGHHLGDITKGHLHVMGRSPKEDYREHYTGSKSPKENLLLQYYFYGRPWMSKRTRWLRTTSPRIVDIGNTVLKLVSDVVWKAD